MEIKKRWTRKQKTKIALESIWLGPNRVCDKYRIKKDKLLRLKNTCKNQIKNDKADQYAYTEPEIIHLQRENARLENCMAHYIWIIQQLFPENTFDL